MHYEVHFVDRLSAKNELGESLLIAGDAWMEMSAQLILEGVQDGLLDYFGTHNLVHSL